MSCIFLPGKWQVGILIGIRWTFLVIFFIGCSWDNKTINLSHQPSTGAGLHHWSQEKSNNLSLRIGFAHKLGLPTSRARWASGLPISLGLKMWASQSVVNTGWFSRDSHFLGYHKPYQPKVALLPETNSKRTWKWMVGILSRFLLRDGPFRGDEPNPLPQAWKSDEAWQVIESW